MAEAKAALLAIKIAKQFGVRKLHLEGDSLIIIQAIKFGESKAWHLQNYVKSIAQDLETFDDFVVSHIKREGNREADILSKWAVSFEEFEKLSVEDFRNCIF